MVNFGLNSGSLLGIFLGVAGVTLFFMRSFRPELSRDQDIFFSAVGLVCAVILLFDGWRLDPLLQLGYFLITAVTVAFGAETLRLRSATTAQAKRGAPTVDRDRRTSRVYRAEIDDMEPSFEEEAETPNRRRLRGSEEDSPRREEATRSSRTRSSRNRARSRPRPASRTRDNYYDEEPQQRFDNRDFDEDELEEEEYVPPRKPRSRRRDNDAPTRAPRKSRPRPSSDRSERPARSRPPVERPPSRRRRPAPPDEDYVDYKPLDSTEEDDDNDNQFDY